MSQEFPPPNPLDVCFNKEVLPLTHSTLTQGSNCHHSHLWMHSPYTNTNETLTNVQ